VFYHKRLFKRAMPVLLCEEKCFNAIFNRGEMVVINTKNIEQINSEKKAY